MPPFLQGYFIAVACVLFPAGPIPGRLTAFPDLQGAVVFEYADRNIKNQSLSPEVHMDSIATAGQGQEAIP